jgi:hypothetical protein
MYPKNKRDEMQAVEIVSSTYLLETNG